MKVLAPLYSKDDSGETYKSKKSERDMNMSNPLDTGRPPPVLGNAPFRIE
jgi:hypothetical protein